MLPSLFLSHGSPMLPLTEAPARHFLEGLAARLEQPRAILVASAHWETARPAVNAVAVNETIHDFRGFPRPLYALRYPAPGSPELAARVAALLGAAGLPADVDPARGLDHGAWVPLLLMYPEAEIPVLQLSLQPDLGPAHHLRLGQALAPLREEGVLVIGSGSFTHDLSEFRGRALEDPAPGWVTEFADWMDLAIIEGRTADLLDYRARAPFAVKNHPTDEHLLPLFVALGAGGDAPRPQHLHASATHGVLRMDAYGFGAHLAVENRTLAAE
jgi:4,5-DOPA dioxygenase extradiol